MNLYAYIPAALAMTMLGMFLTASGIGGLPFVLIAIMLAGAKAAGVDMSWWWVALPIYGGLSGAVLRYWYLATHHPIRGS